jgi:hypothetical protein
MPLLRGIVLALILWLVGIEQAVAFEGLPKEMARLSGNRSQFLPGEQGQTPIFDGVKLDPDALHRETAETKSAGLRAQHHHS